MSITFLSPAAALLALICIAPLVAFVLVRRRGRRTRTAVGLEEPARRTYVAAVTSIVLVGCLLGIAAAQPVVSLEETIRMRTDAEALFVLDTSKSMLARKGPGSATRLGRAKADALALRAAIPTVPVGLASVTDRTLPYLFPSPDENTFQRTLAASVGIERPPPVEQLLARVTRLDSLGAVATQGFFSPAAQKRIVVVFTDGESLPQTNPHLTSLFARPPGIETVFVQVWKPDEHVFAGRLPNPAYRPDPTARQTLGRFATTLRAKVFREEEIREAAQGVRGLAGSGPTVARGKHTRYIALAPFFAAAAFLPLLLLLWRRDR